MDLKFLVLIRGMREEGDPKVFLCYPRDSGTSYQSFRERGGVFSKRRLLTLIKSMVVGLVEGVLGQWAVV